jgi:hypothetical protein
MFGEALAYANKEARRKAKARARRRARATQPSQPLFCGPAAIVHITGIDPDVILARCREELGVRRVTGMPIWAVERVLGRSGYRLREVTVRANVRGLPFWKVGARVSGPCLVMSSSHYVVVDGLLMTDQSSHTLAGDHWARNQRVRRCYLIEEQPVSMEAHLAATTARRA